MKEKLIELLKVKSIVTLFMTIALVVGFFMGMISGEKICEFALMIFTYYFAKKDTKYNGEE